MTFENITTEVVFPTQELANIASQLSTGESWNDGAITGSFSFSSGGGDFKGWITYYDGTKVYIQLEKIESKTGTAAGTLVLPYIRAIPWENYVGKLCEVEMKGFMFSGRIHMTCEGHSITQQDITVASVAPADYYLRGIIKCTKA